MYTEWVEKCAELEQNVTKIVCKCYLHLLVLATKSLYSKLVFYARKQVLEMSFVWKNLINDILFYLLWTMFRGIPDTCLFVVLVFF